MKDYVLFDFDGTLATRDTTRYLIRALLAARPWRGIALFPGIIGLIALRGRGEALQFWKYRCIGTLLRGLTPGRTKAVLAVFAIRVRPLLRPWLMEILDEYRCRGTGLLIVTASPRIAVEALFLGGDVEVIGAEFSTVHGRYTGKLDGAGSYGQAKVGLLTEWLSRQNGEAALVEAWSDSLSDDPMMRMAARRNWVCAPKDALAIERADPAGVIHVIG